MVITTFNGVFKVVMGLPIGPWKNPSYTHFHIQLSLLSRLPEVNSHHGTWKCPLQWEFSMAPALQPPSGRASRTSSPAAILSRWHRWCQEPVLTLSPRPPPSRPSSHSQCQSWLMLKLHVNEMKNNTYV